MHFFYMIVNQMFKMEVDLFGNPGGFVLWPPVVDRMVFIARLYVIV
jgi:hypothetical protein